MTDRAGLQMVGAYTTDDSTNDKTVVNAVRSMTEAQRAALPASEQHGFIYTTDTGTYQMNAFDVPYTTDKTVHKAIEELSTGEANVRVMTDAEYEALDPEERYGIILTDVENPYPVSSNAVDISYINTESQLTATTLQAALDELNAKLDNYINSLNN